MKMNLRFITVAMLLLLTLTPVILHASEITDKVRSTVDGIINILKDQSLNAPGKKDERRARIRSLITERFNFEEMSKLSLARHWGDRSDEEKKEFISLFSDLIENSYIEKIERYTDEEIIYADEKRSGGRAEVKTVIISKGTDTHINYRLIKTTDDWMVYDIVIEGVSLVSNYRSQFSSTIRATSYEGLVKKLREKTRKI